MLEERRRAGGRFALSIADAVGVWVFRFDYCCWRRHAGDLHDFIVVVIVVVVAGETVAANMNDDSFA